MSFLETPRFPDDIAYGSAGGPNYSTTIIRLRSGYERRDVKWPYPINSFDVAYGVKEQQQMYSLIEFFHVVAGMGHGFRFKDFSDHKSCVDQRSASSVTSIDQDLGIGDGVVTEYQLQKTYTKGAMSQIRPIKKPIVGTVIIAIGAVAAQRWSVDTTTGLVTFSTDLNYTITDAVSSGTDTVFTVAANALVIGDNVLLDGFTGNWGWLNGARYVVTAANSNTFTIAFDSSAYAVYSSNGGITNTIPQLTEVVTAGFEFDLPCRFDSDTLSAQWESYQLQSTSVAITEIRML